MPHSSVTLARNWLGRAKRRFLTHGRVGTANGMGRAATSS